MRRTLAMILALIFVLTVPACAAEAQIPLGDAGQTHNMLLAASMIDCTTVAPGESFSFNAIVGPRTEERGFVPGLNGRGVEVVGGGTARAATALYLALQELQPGTVSFDELSFYGDRYTENYVADGGLAILVDYSNGRDFRFTNLTSGELMISMINTGADLYCAVSLAEAETMWFEATENAPAADAQARPVTVEIFCGTDPNVLTNVALAADSIYDLTLVSGDVFSFNAVVGPREERYGYVEATNGRGAVVVGGGVAQVASAIWLLVQNRPDIAIIEKSTYGSKYNQHYVANSSDAILVDYDAGIDFAFRYTGEAPLTLYPTLIGSTLLADSVSSQLLPR